MLKTKEEQEKKGLEFIASRHKDWTPEAVRLEYDRAQESVNAKIPARYLKTKPEDIPKELEEYVGNKDSKGLYLWGGVGSGKTHALYAIRKYYAREMILLRVENLSEFLAEIKRSFSDDYPVTILDYANKFVAYDDIGTEKESEWAGEQLYRLINFLYEKEKPVLFTSNLSLAKLAERYGETGDRIASRIAEMCEVVELKGKDKRV